MGIGLKVFITGVAGFLGSHLAQRLVAEGHEVSGCDNLSGGYLSNIPKGVTFHNVDCLDFKAMKRLTKVDVVYNVAAAAHEGLSHFSPYYFTLNTYGSTVSVLSAAVNNRVKRFVQISSAAHYGNLTPPFNEDMLPVPVDPYGIAKYAADLTVENICNTHGVEFSIIVPHNIIGTRQKYDDPYRNVVAIFINQMLQGISPHIYGDGTQKRCFSFVSDVVEPLVLAGTLPAANGQKVNVGPDSGEITINELYNILAELTGFTGQPEYLPPRPNEVHEVLCSADKARRLLKYSAKTPLHEGLAEMVSWVKSKGVKPFIHHLPIEIASPLIPAPWQSR